tara:strand:- start:132 stop:773 length:642 start_codon:yes stop_codon:yes gene_type:complete
MEVILLERIEKLGQMGDVVKVKAGYARNFLLPHKKAMRVNEANRAMFEQHRAQLEAENLEKRADAERVSKDLNNLQVIIVRQASDSDQLYGSVTTRDISSAVVAAGVTIDRRQVQLDSPIKTIGMHPVRVVLHPEVSVEVIVNVARSTEEAEMQARGERINRDGELVNIDEENNDVAADEMFEETAATDAAADVINEEAHGVAGNDTTGEQIS